MATSGAEAGLPAREAIVCASWARKMALQLEVDVKRREGHQAAGDRRGIRVTRAVRATGHGAA